MAGGDDGFHSGELSVIGRISTASNVTLVCEVVGAETAQGTPLRVVYKPVRGGGGGGGV
ncbi:hypothetical protein [Nocardia farcinica]|uniref:hypothetical protein n=1 Tax=Nocardia farcinica TaxID=37329 RepID=UPI003CC7EF82